MTWRTALRDKGPVPLIVDASVVVKWIVEECA
jgi:hypothetical protein